MSFLQIGTWNIEHLSNRTNNKQSAYALADHIEMAGIQILAMQEVYVTHDEDGRRRNTDLDLVCTLLHEHLGTEWDYELFPNRQQGDTSQLCGVFWDEGRVNLTGQLRIDVPDRVGADPVWDRTPHAARFTAPVQRWRQVEQDGETIWVQFDETSSIIVIPLHMKSNYGGEARARRRREKEARELVSRLEGVMDHFDGDRSLILIGDTNMLDRNEPGNLLFTDFGLDDLNFADQPTYPGYGGAPFDRVYVLQDRPEFRYTRQYILQSSNEAQHDKFLSDHYLVKASVKIYLDDADPRDWI